MGKAEETVTTNFWRRLFCKHFFDPIGIGGGNMGRRTIYICRLCGHQKGLFPWL